MSSIFPLPVRLKRAISRINSLDTSKFSIMLSKIFQKLHVKNEMPFTETEEERLIDVLTLEGKDDLSVIIETCQFIYYQAIYHLMNYSSLREQLKLIELNEDIVDSFVNLWEKKNTEVIAKIKVDFSLAPQKLSSIDWMLNLFLSKSTLSTASHIEPRAIFSLETASSINISKTEKSDIISLEFDHSQLYNFYNQIEQIQTQLDALG